MRILFPQYPMLETSILQTDQNTTPRVPYEKREPANKFRKKQASKLAMGPDLGKRGSGISSLRYMPINYPYFLIIRPKRPPPKK